jgi:hypothetical protein
MREMENILRWFGAAAMVAVAVCTLYAGMLLVESLLYH